MDSISLRCLIIAKKSWHTLKIGRVLFQAHFQDGRHRPYWKMNFCAVCAICLLWLFWWWQIHFQFYCCNLRSISPYIPTLNILNEWIMYYVWNNSDVNDLVEISPHQLLFFDKIHQTHIYNKNKCFFFKFPDFSRAGIIF